MALRYLLLIVTGAGLVASGIGLVYLPAGVIAAGVELASAGYVGLYLDARRT